MACAIKQLQGCGGVDGKGRYPPQPCAAINGRAGILERVQVEVIFSLGAGLGMDVECPLGECQEFCVSEVSCEFQDCVTSMP